MKKEENPLQQALDALIHARTVLNHYNLPLECGPINEAIIALQAASPVPADHQGKLLAKALGECIMAAGIVRKDIDGLSGPQLLMFAEDLKRHLAAPAQAVAVPVDNNLLGEIIDCFDAALDEGLMEALLNTRDARLADLVTRRLMHAYYAAIGPSFSTPAQAVAVPDAWVATPATPGWGDNTKFYCHDKEMAERWQIYGHPDYGQLLVTPLFKRHMEDVPAGTVVYVKK